MKKKYAILVGDGMADKPLAVLENKTPLEYAATPNMDSVAAQGAVGTVQTIPDGYQPGSDVANMSLMGYDPALYYTGRGPIEAASLGIPLSRTDTAFRCNLVCLGEGRMVDYSAGHIETDDAAALIAELRRNLDSDTIHFYPGVSYRHLLVIGDFPGGELRTVPPHDISGMPYEEHLPRGVGSDRLSELSAGAHGILAQSVTNTTRIAAGMTPATDIWLWGRGNMVALPALRDRYGLCGSVVSAVDLVKGLGKMAGLRIRTVKGATGYLDTNYEGKVTAAHKALREEDFVFLHVEAPDEASHEGIVEKKIRAIEDFDRHVVGGMLKVAADIGALRLAVLPDHATLLSTKTHDRMPVPFAVCGPGVTIDDARAYSEGIARKQGKKVYTGSTFFDSFMCGDFC